MTVIQQRRNLDHRAIAAIPSVSVTNGLIGTATAGQADPNATGLLDNTVAAQTPTSTPDLPVATSAIIQPDPSAIAAPSTTPSATPSSSSGNDASLGTLIAACVGAGVGVILLVLIAVWYSRRLSRQAKKPGRPNTKKRRSSWGNLSEEYHDDKWEGMQGQGQGQGRGQRRSERQPSTSLAKRASLGSVAKLGAMFHRSPSVTSCEKSSEGHGAESVGTMHHFAQYHPGLAQELAGASSSKTPSPPPIMRNVAGGGAAMSWEGRSNTVGSDSFLSLKHGSHIDLSPVVSMAKSTPPVSDVGSTTHYWESAEVIHPETASLEPHLQNPFDDTASTTMSMSTATSSTPIIKSGGGGNPFFAAQERQTANPFSDTYAAPKPMSINVEPPRAPEPAATARREKSDTVVAAHNPSGSRDHAMQSLLAALDIPESEVRDRLRIASMQSGISGLSYLSEDGASVSGFPLPPTQVPRP
ncbi:hypothetical protein CONPUDRAFT_142515 [Coniophora puteana RWD-64-598 SS2]|uniref:Uncharacterized protein n=1 Tax=Coniophora puteana (strain RWD-64-598) TaxID=741705 RepID=A0A5M3MY72_CONPW|nr:uncharacterized protein CONPUDRAFT_142515 [Coniophora puteana RWD-64-598 SS2]EIW84070.1 hypothetical protein CONPUDRAFT_142515 [Coniophora puteana RWD-64-598 SS2]